jgi:hypothetical protein
LKNRPEIRRRERAKLIDSHHFAATFHENHIPLLSLELPESHFSHFFPNSQCPETMRFVKLYTGKVLGKSSRLQAPESFFFRFLDERGKKAGPDSLAAVLFPHINAYLAHPGIYLAAGIIRNRWSKSPKEAFRMVAF